MCMLVWNEIGALICENFLCKKQTFFNFADMTRKNYALWLNQPNKKKISAAIKFSTGKLEHKYLTHTTKIFHTSRSYSN